MNAPTLDPLALDQLRPFKGHDGGSLLGNLIQVYLEQLPDRVEGLLKAHGEGDARSVFKIAHTLKSTSASLGAYGLQGLCQRLEDAGRLDELPGTAGLIPLFQAEAAKVRAALLDEQKRLGP
ncbi:MAG: Hpt domain-containing protein [Holophagaceae bacterium]|nr:Hpt domain-containing protein [Holophagaceae bacterium]